MPVSHALPSDGEGRTDSEREPERLKEVNKDVEELGAKVIHQWACLGPFDFVNIVEAPDATTVARVSVRLGARGSSSSRRTSSSRSTTTSPA